MSDQAYETIDESTLASRLAEAKPDNVDPDEGFALINVLDSESFAHKHIPQSINIPLANIAEAMEHFSLDKELIVYCGSASCDASPKAAKALSELGFSRIKDFEGGLSDWKAAGHGLVGAAA